MSTITRSITVSGTALGKPIPLSCGHRRLGGQVVWLSPTYKYKEVSSEEYAARYIDAYGSRSTPNMSDPTFRTVVTTIDFVVSFGYAMAKEADRGDLRLTEVRAVPVCANAHAPKGQPQLLWSKKTGLVPRYFPDVTLEWREGKIGDPPPSIFYETRTDPPSLEGQMLLVVRNFPVDNVIGTMITLPLVLGEIVDGMFTYNEATPYETIDDTIAQSSDAIFVDPTTGEVWTVTGMDSPTTGFRKWSLFDLKEVKRSVITGTVEGHPIWSPGPHPYKNIMLGRSFGGNGGPALDLKKRLLLTNADPSSNSRPVVSISLNSNTIIGQFGYEGNALSPTKLDDETAFKNLTWMMVGVAQEGVLAMACWPNWGALMKYSDDGTLPTTIPVKAVYNLLEGEIGIITAMQFLDTPVFPTGGRIVFGYGNKILVHPFYWRNGVDLIWGRQPLPGQTSEQVNLLIGTLPSGASVNQILVVPNESPRRVVVLYSTSSGAFRAASFSSVFAAGMSPVALWDVPLPGFSANSTSTFACTNSDLSEGTFAIFESDNGGMLDLRTGRFDTWAPIIPRATDPMPRAFYFWDSKTQTATYPSMGTGGKVYELSFGNIGSEPVPLKNFLRYCCEWLGYKPEEYYIDEQLTDELVGVSITDVYSAPKLFADLGRIYNFSYVESGGKKKFVRATVTGAGNIATVAQLGLDDLVPIGEGDASDHECLITELSRNSQDSFSVSVKHRLLTAFTEFWSTVSYNTDPTQPATEATSENTIEIPVFMSTREATKRASRMSLTTVSGSITQTFRLSWRHSLLEPSDPVSIELHGKHYTIILKDVTYNGDMSLSCVGRNYGYVDDVDPDGPDDPELPVPTTGFSDSFPVVLDIPLAWAFDDRPGVLSVYLGVSGYGQSGWQSATLQAKKTDDSTMVSLFEALTSAKTGTTASPLPPTNRPFTPDETTVLEVVGMSLLADHLQSCSTLNDFHDGKNAIAVGAPGRWEIIYFRDVEVVSDKAVKLTGLLRGRRGTEVHTDDHTVGDTVVLLYTAKDGVDTAIRQSTLSADQLGGNRDYKAVGKVVRSLPQSTTLEVLGNSAKPWATVGHKAVKTGSDIVLTWERRTRLYGPWVDGSGDVPLDEDAELYDLEVYSGTTVVRQVSNIATPAYTYTEAQQLEDGFAVPPSELEVKVYQKSALVGRGFAKKVTVDVQ